MRHYPVIHPMGCACDRCVPRLILPLWPILRAMLLAALPTYGLALLIWTVLPR